MPPPPALPEELLTEILSYHCTIPDTLFFSNTYSTTNTRAPSYQPNPSILLVSRQWNRCALPAFYHTVIIRSKACYASLKAALQCHRDPSISSCVRRLRIEDGYDDTLGDIVRLVASGITDLCVSLMFKTGLKEFQEQTGLFPVDFFAGMKPRKVAVVDSSFPSWEGSWHSKVRESLGTRICDAIETEWTTMETFYYPYTHSYQTIARNQQTTPITMSLCTSTSLRKLIIQPKSLIAPHLVHITSRNPHITQIFVKPPTESQSDSDSCSALRVEKALRQEEDVRMGYPRGTMEGWQRMDAALIKGHSCVGLLLARAGAYEESKVISRVEN